MSCFDIRGIVEEVQSIVAVKVRLREIQYTSYVGEEVPSTIYADPNRIRQVMLNLVENAIKFNVQKGRVLLSIIKIEDSMLKVDVVDSGKGISSSQMKTLFAFNSIDSEGRAADCPDNRISVSLPIAYEICKQLGGELRVESQVGHGSTFSFSVRTQPIPAINVVLETLHTKSPADCDIEEEYQRVPDVQRPLPSMVFKRMSSSNSHLSYGFRSVVRPGLTSSSDSKLKAPTAEDLALLAIPKRRDQITSARRKNQLREEQKNPFKVREIDMSALSPFQSGGQTASTAFTKTHRISAFKLEVHPKISLDQEPRTSYKEQVSSGFTNRVRCSLLGFHKREKERDNNSDSIASCRTELMGGNV